METDHGLALVSLVLIPIFTHIILRSAVNHIYALGRSSTYLKKHRRDIPFVRRILLTGYEENCKYYAVQARRLRKIYWISTGYQLICILCWALSGVLSPAADVLPYLISIKVVLLDIPLLVFFFVMTKHGKNGGVTWKWEV